MTPEDMDIWTGKEEVDAYEEANPPPEPRNMYFPPLLSSSLIIDATMIHRWEKIWFAIA